MSSGESAKANCICEHEAEGDFANSNRSRYLKGRSRETDRRRSAKLTHRTEWAAVNQKRQSAFAQLKQEKATWTIAPKRVIRIGNPRS